MAYVNVAEWSPDHVAEWLKGLEYSLLPYVHFFLNNEIDGSHLLNLTADDLEDLHIFKVGHQQLILEAVELLRQLHYNLTSETLQSLAVKLGCKARSLYNDLKLNGPQDHTQYVRQERVSMCVLSAVSEVLTSVKSLISWLDRLPFQRDPSCIKLKKIVLKLSIELASTTQRDQFAEKPHSLIKRNSLQLAELCDKFIQDSKDSLILQPASLDISMIKKKPDEELGIHIKSTYSGVHIVGGIKDQSPAKRCSKVEKDDEIIQVNYQTVIGWQQKKLVTAMTEHSSELHLTIKKRPRHINILGEVIILRPYRIPSKKTASKCHEWSEDNQLRAQDTCSTSNESECMRDDFNDDEDDSAFLPADTTSCHLLLTKDMSVHCRLLPGGSPAVIQRRATVSGASPTVLKPPVNIEELVNAVSFLKNSEAFGRSISHDPACHRLNIEVDNNENVKENKLHKEEELCDNKMVKKVNYEESSHTHMGLSPKNASNSQPKDPSYDGKFDTPVLEISLLREGDDSNTFKNELPRDEKKYESKNLDSKISELGDRSSCSKLSVSSISGNRRISCKDLGKGDCEGYLYKQKEHAGFSSSSYQWVKRWIVLKNFFLYIYRDSNDFKAECLISLPGSHVTQAFECKTKKYAFKVCQQHATFYFATNSQEDGVKWLNKISLATVAYETSADITVSGFSKPDVFRIANNFYSETDDSESKSPPTSRKADFSVEMLTSSSSSSELSYDHYIKSNKNIKAVGPSSLKSSNDSPILKTKKQYQNNKDLVPSYIKCKTQDNVEVRHSVSNVCGVTTTEGYLKSNSNFVETPCQKASYNKLFSYAEASYCHFKTDPKNLMYKINDEKATTSQPLSHNICNKTKYSDQNWNSVDEQYDVSTSSLGRQQKPLAKEITPGLVARMTVSYSNLTRKNAEISSNKEKKVNHHKVVPEEGYVAKISDSYDYLARTGTLNAFSDFENKGKKLQHASSGVEAVSERQHACYKRSASESQVSKRTSDFNSKAESLNTTFPYDSCTGVMNKEIKKHTERFVSLLDKEYNRVFEGKKVSQSQIKSHSKGHFNQIYSDKREMRFFPISDVPKRTLINNCPKSNSIHAVKEVSKFSSGNTPYRTWYDSSDKAYQYPGELKKVQSFDLNTRKNILPTSCGAHVYYTHLDSSEGIENIGFSCVDQLSHDSFGSNVSNYPKVNELCQRHNRFSSTNTSTQIMPHNLKVSEDSLDTCSPKGTSFKLFNSPKFMKKLTSPKLDKKNIFKNKKQAREKKAEQKEIATVQNDKKFFGSPRLVRAIFGSPKSQKKLTVSSAVQTDQISLSELSSESENLMHDLNRNNSFITALDIPSNIDSYIESHEQEMAISKSSSNSSLNSNISNSLYTSSLYYVEARIKPQITISLPLVTDKQTSPKTPRTLLKPTMGVAMLSKKRLPSVSGESSISVSSSKSSHDESIKEVVPLRTEVSMDINGDELIEALETLEKVGISSDTSDLSSYLSKASSPSTK